MAWSLISSAPREYWYEHGCGHQRKFRTTKSFVENKQRCIRCEKVTVTPIEQLYNIYLSSAKKRNLSFDLDIRDMEYLIRSNCFYCGTTPNISVSGRWSAEVWYSGFKRVGLDRIEPDDGYNIDNVVPCCFDCNKLKGNMTFDGFVDLIRKINKNLCRH